MGILKSGNVPLCISAYFSNALRLVFFYAQRGWDVWLYCTQGRELKLEDFDPQTGEAVYRVRGLWVGWRGFKTKVVCVL